MTISESWICWRKQNPFNMLSTVNILEPQSTTSKRWMDVRVSANFQVRCNELFERVEGNLGNTLPSSPWSVIRGQTSHSASWVGNQWPLIYKFTLNELLVKQCSSSILRKPNFQKYSYLTKNSFWARPQCLFGAGITGAIWRQSRTHGPFGNKS